MYRIIELDLSEVAVYGSQRKAPCGGEDTGKSPVDRGKLGWKGSLMTVWAGIPFAGPGGGNRHDVILFPPTLEAAAKNGLLEDIETLHLDRGCNKGPVRDLGASPQQHRRCH